MKKVLSTTVFILLAYIGFAVNTMFAPTLVAPVNNAVNQMPNAFLNWSAVPGAFSYKIQVSTDSLFGTSKKYATNLTAINSANLLFNSKYFWRVKAIGVNDSSDWSTVFYFKTISTVTMIKPGDSSINRPVSTYLKWTAIAGITGYEYQIDTSLTFSSPLFVTSIIAANKIEAYSKQLAFGENYYLRMRARHIDDTTDWSQIMYFSTLNDISIIKPQDDTIKKMPVVKLEWQWVGSKYYEYAIAIDSAFTSPMYYTNDTTKITLIPGDTIIRVFTDTLLFNQKYFWKVRAKNALDTSNWSAIKRFSTINQFSLIAPANGTNDVALTPTFRWDSLSSIKSYIMEIDDNTSFTSPITLSLPNTSATYIYGGPSLANSTPYYWRMRAITTVDSTDWSNSFMFKTISPAGIENAALDNNSVSIYPNPSTNGLINIQIESSSDQVVFMSLVNMVGQEIYSEQLFVKSGNNAFSIDLNDKNNGIYFLKLHNGDKTLTRKIILNK